MVRQHIKRDYSAHRKNVIRPDEYIKAEIMAYDKEYTVFVSYFNQIFGGYNFKETKWQSDVAYGSLNGTHRFEIDIPYTVKEHGEYRFDILYVNNNSQTKTGMLHILNTDGEKVVDETISFDGDVEFKKRKVEFHELGVGEYTVRWRVPVNCLFIGSVIRKIRYCIGTREGTDGDFFIQECSINTSSATSPKELSLKLPYDVNFEDYDNLSGFIFDYQQEINIYGRNEEDDIKQIFGGRISSVLGDEDKQQITITGADRLNDGNKRYVMEEMVLLGGDTENPEYFQDNIHDFETYGHGLSYLTSVFEETLNDNVNENYLVAGETYQTGFVASLGNKGSTVKPVVNNMDLTMADQFILLRNNPDQTLTQSAILYNNNDYQSDPPKITDYPTFYLTYGLGDPVTTTESTETVNVEVNTETSPSTPTTVGSYNQYGVSSDGSKLMAIGLPSAYGELGKYGYNFKKSVFVRKCPFCGSSELYWSIFWAGNETSNWGIFPATGRSEGGSAEGHIFCKACDADFSCIDGRDHTSNPVYLKRVSGPENSSKQEAYALKGGQGGSSTGETTTTTTKVTNGYDKSKPFECYVEIVFATEPGKNNRTYNLMLDFTRISSDSNSFTGIKPVLINNIVKQGSVDVKEYMALISETDIENTDYYLHEVKLKAHPLNQENKLFESSESNIDNSSCKMDFYNFGFREGMVINPTNLQACGKTVSSMLETLVKDSGYLVEMNYSKHRKDDIINFKVDNELNPSYIVTEGDDNNILNISNISYTPVNNLYNNSVCVYKKQTEHGEQYYFVNSKYSHSILEYGELTTLETQSDPIEDRQAYYYARKNPNFTKDITFSYTLTLPGLINLNIGDLVKCIMNSKYLNDIKKVMSVKYNFSWAGVPRWQTTIGLDEISPEFKAKKKMQEIRRITREENTVFSKTAQHVDNSELYEWEH